MKRASVVGLNQNEIVLREGACHRTGKIRAGKASFTTSPSDQVELHGLPRSLVLRVVMNLSTDRRSCGWQADRDHTRPRWSRCSPCCRWSWSYSDPGGFSVVVGVVPASQRWEGCEPSLHYDVRPIREIRNDRKVRRIVRTVIRIGLPRERS